jgi:hypothetical protein
MLVRRIFGSDAFRRSTAFGCREKRKLGCPARVMQQPDELRLDAIEINVVKAKA